MSKTDLTHAQPFTELLKGKVIKNTRYLSKQECNDMDWHKRPLAIEFSDGTCLFALTDDEGNDGGALAFFNYQTKESRTMYVLS